MTSGYRVCLVYNLIQRINSLKIQSPESGTQQQRLAQLLKGNTLIFANRPKEILLGHQYTPTNFSENALKNNAVPRAEVLLSAAAEADYFANLALVANHLSGELMMITATEKEARGGITMIMTILEKCKVIIPPLQRAWCRLAKNPS